MESIKVKMSVTVERDLVESMDQTSENSKPPKR
jgi:hypothetical protein